MAKIPTRTADPDLTPGRRGCEVASTAIGSLSYDETKRELYVTWSGGGEYVYYGVSPAIYQAACAAPSKGKFMNRVIKGTTGGRAKGLGVGGAYNYKRVG